LILTPQLKCCAAFREISCLADSFKIGEALLIGSLL
jgi:hypothetical protein